MENNQGWKPSSALPLGPRSSRAERPLSAGPARVLALLLDQPEALTQAAIADAADLHPNTIREHLDTLLRRGLATRARSEPSGRGRPAWLYAATGSTARETEYAGLAAALAGSISRTSDSPRRDATLAGEQWGHELARGRGAAPLAAEIARDRVVELLDDLGFEPTRRATDPGELRLTRCPLLQAAHRHPEVVCAVHLGIIRGALEEYGADPTGTDLLAFAEPGACHLVVPPVVPPVESPVESPGP